MNLKKVIEKYAANPAKLTIRTFVESGEIEETYVLVEGEVGALRFLGEAILAFANSDSGCNWGIHPKGAGNIYFGRDATAGIYLHKMPCELHATKK